MTHTNRILWAGTVLLVAAALHRDCPAADSTGAPSLRETMLDHRDHFLEMQLGPADAKSQSEEWLRAFLQGLQPGSEVAADDWNTALRRLVSAGMREHTLGQKTGFIEEPAVVDLAVAALGEENAETREIGRQALTWSTRRADLEKHAAVIKLALAGARDEEAMRLLALLPWSGDERAALLSETGAWPEIRARLGDAAAERELIEAFQAEPAWNRMRNLARDLGYAGTEGCVRALLGGLRSQVSSEGEYDDRSIRCAILVALGRVYQEEPLFTTDAWLLAENSDPVFDKRRGLVTYGKAVNAWVKEKFGQEVWDPATVWFIRYSEEPRVEPR